MVSNPLRVFDCKVDRCQEVMTTPRRLRPLIARIVKNTLIGYMELIAELSIPVQSDPRLVRGLDYYCRTTFEVSASHLGVPGCRGRRRSL